MEARVKSHISIQWVEDGEPRQNKWKKIGTIIEKKKNTPVLEKDVFRLKEVHQLLSRINKQAKIQS